MYAELHCHSYYSFHDGASSLEELLLRAKELGYQALALTDHNNLCGAMRFARLTRSLEIQGITGAEVTLKGDYHLTLLVKDNTGYSNLCRLITAAHQNGERNEPELPPELIPEHAAGLICLSGCPSSELAQLVAGGHFPEAKNLIRRYLEWFGSDNYYLELQRNLVFGESERNKKLMELAAACGVKVAATGNVHYHIRERHQLQDCLVAIQNCKSLEETHRERRPNSEFYLRPVPELEALFQAYPEALENTLKIAERCTLDLTKDLSYSFPDYAAPDGLTQDAYLEKLCHEAAIRRYGSITPEVQQRLDEEFRLIKKYNLAGFLLLYHEVIKLGREVMIRAGTERPVPDPGRKPTGARARFFRIFTHRLSYRAFPHRPTEIQTVAGAFSAGRYDDQRPGYRPRFPAQYPRRFDSAEPIRNGAGSTPP